MRDLTGIQLGPFTIERLLGVGGFAQVYKAFDISTNTPCVLKLLHQHLVKNTQVVSAFLREGRFASSFIHQNIVRVLQVAEIYAQPYLTMEFHDGITLDRLPYAESSREGSIEDLYKIIQGVAQALKYLHTLRHIHRDVKPANILVLADMQSKLLDFGLALPLLGAGLRNKQVLGTPVYMAPELWTGKNYTPRTDVYALAMTVKRVMNRFQIVASTHTVSLLAQALNDNPARRPSDPVEFVDQLFSNLREEETR